eukprot:TRINITY_DN2042_c0_g1_i1.p1 TRINITY_DN2042_c0_g1~~TRINITY_DN2042_c0_g1_i1.p1  ORF type:complete len:373 (-),score=114.55 TRINITY_DN2042_c0_g1_i1:80-1198(-)
MSMDDRALDETFEKQKKIHQDKELKLFRRIVNKSRSVQDMFDLPRTDFWIKDFSCAIERGILWHGRMYITRYHLCFYANILGKVVKEKVNWNCVKAIEKDTHGLINPSLVVYSTQEKNSNYNRQFFTSFGSRDKSYKVLMRTWLEPSNLADKNNVAIGTFLCNSNLKKRETNSRSSENLSKSATVPGASAIRQHPTGPVRASTSKSVRVEPRIMSKSTTELIQAQRSNRDASAVHLASTSSDAASREASSSDSDSSSSERDNRLSKSMMLSMDSKKNSAKLLAGARHHIRTKGDIESFSAEEPLAEKKRTRAGRELSISIRPSIILYLVLLILLFGALVVWIIMIDRQIESLRTAVASSRILVENGILGLKK